MSKFIKIAIVALFSCSALVANAGILKDFDSLGGNDVLYDKAKALNPEADVTVVQGRIVNRRRRHELDFNAMSVVGGNPYLHTNSLGLGYHFHITPRWSLGLQGNMVFNDLNDEGRNLIDDKFGPPGKGPSRPELDYQKSNYELNVNWYPFYGKFAFFNWGVVHFDFYAILGVGQAKLNYTGDKTTYSYGAGLGFWVSQYMSTRIEFKSHNYSAKVFSADIDYNLAQLMISAGWML